MDLHVHSQRPFDTILRTTTSELSVAPNRVNIKAIPRVFATNAGDTVYVDVWTGAD